MSSISGSDPALELGAVETDREREYLHSNESKLATAAGEYLDSSRVQECRQSLEGRKTEAGKAELTSSLGSAVSARRYKDLLKTQLMRPHSENNLVKFDTRRESVHNMVFQELQAKERMLEQVKSLSVKQSELSTGLKQTGFDHTEHERKLQEDIAAMKKRYDEEIEKVNCEHQCELRQLRELTERLQMREEGEGRVAEVEGGMEERRIGLNSHSVRAQQASQGSEGGWRVHATLETGPQDVDVGEEREANLGIQSGELLQDEYSEQLHQQQGGSSDKDKGREVL